MKADFIDERELQRMDRVDVYYGVKKNSKISREEIPPDKY